VLILVRHGRTQANAEGRLQGRMDLPLDELGERQALAIGATLGRVELVVTSPLTRARQTAAAIDGPCRVEERLIELDYGALDGSLPGDIPDEAWERLRVDLDYIPDGGVESLGAVGRRVVPLLDELSSAAIDADIVVVSHVSPIKAAIAWALGVGQEIAWRTHLEQASICRIRMSPRGPVLVTYNETAHLR
jgi:broad specificity phosphatase PhoE